MKLAIKYFFLILFLFFLSEDVVSIQHKKVENVFIIVADQFRHDESFGDRTYKHIPYLWNNLVPHASRCVTFYGNPAYTVLAHLAILTGSWKDIQRLEPWTFPDRPTIFEYYRKHFKKDEKSCYFITSKPEFNYMHYSTHKEYGQDYQAYFELTKNPNDDEELYEKLLIRMKKHHPSLVFVILGGLKSFNSKRRKEEVDLYRKQLVKMDTILYKIWNAIQEDKIYKDKTTLFFLNDHGDFIDHEDCDDECKRYLVMVALGPNIKKNYLSKEKWRQINVCPTVGKILGFPTPYASRKTKVIEDFFIESEKNDKDK